MKFDLESITELAATITPWIKIGQAGVGIVLSVVDAVQKAEARGTPPTEEELHQIALDGRAAFEALPKPE